MAGAATTAVSTSPRWRSPGRVAAFALAPAALCALVAALPHLLPLLPAVFLTPVAKEAWILAAGPVFGIAPIEAATAILLLEVSVCASALLVHAALSRAISGRGWIAARVDAFAARVRASRLARRGLAAALALVIALPFHSGGAILTGLAAPSLGLPRSTALLAFACGTLVRLGATLAITLGVVAIVF